MTRTLALRLAQLALRVVPPLLRAAKRDVAVTDIEDRQAWIRREIEKQRADRRKAQILR